MKVSGCTAIVTGANRGLGHAFVRVLLARGAAKVYAAARSPGGVIESGEVPMVLDITNPSHVAAAADVARDVTLVVNNAAVSKPGSVLNPAALEYAKEEFSTNVIGTLRVAQAFAPVLAANGGGAIINVLSVASWRTSPQMATYGASKAAQWSVTNSLRAALHEQGTHVLGLHVSYMDTDMAKGLDAPKLDPEIVASATLDGLEMNDMQVLVGDRTLEVHRGLSEVRSSYLII